MPPRPTVLAAALVSAFACASPGQSAADPRERRAAPLPRRAEARFEAFLAREHQPGVDAEHLAFLDRGAGTSPWPEELARLPELLGRSPDGKALVSLGVAPADRSGGRCTMVPFPRRGVRPPQLDSLAFLPAEVAQACVVVGSQADGRVWARWHGRRPFEPDQCWSATKQLQAFHVASALGRVAPEADLGRLRLRAAGTNERGESVRELLRDMVSYGAGVPRSNAAGATLGELFRRAEREAWNELHTGNDHEFQGNYGFAPLFARPELADEAGRVLLRAPDDAGPKGQNLVSVYDVTRLTAMAAWHPHLPPDARLADATWEGLAPILSAMGQDSARYVDVALQALGVTKRVRDVVVASKLGMGVRDATGLTEIVYVAAVQLVDEGTTPPTLRQVVFTLRGAHQDALVLDARMAEATAELLRRLLDEELL